jgi:hypothetical protein
MEDLDKNDNYEHDDETMFLSDVVREDHELLFLDSYLRDVFRGRRVHGVREANEGGGETFDEANTL